MVTLNQIPAVQTEMLIRRPVREVYEAFVDPAVTTKFWFTKSSGRLEQGRRIRWDWEMYGVGDNVYVRELEQDKYIVIESSDGTITEWIFVSRNPEETMVTIRHSGFEGSGDEVVSQALDSMGGYTMVLCALKALLEHQVILNVVADKAPDGHV